MSGAAAGVWATHFVAMLAFRPNLPIGYDLGLTSLSIVLAIAITGLGLGLALYRPRFAGAGRRRRGRLRRLDALRRHGRDARPGDRELGRALCRRRARDRRRVRRGRAPDRHDDARPEGPHARRAAALRDGGLALTVADTGIGIAPENIAEAFESFRQIDSRSSRRYEGAGLGLPLTKQLVELHGGSIALDSRAGQGTTATVTFPAARVVPAETRIAA